MQKIALAIHGGAGTIQKSAMTAELEESYRKGLQSALESGWNILKTGGNAIDAVEASVISLENNRLFNAGKGSVFTHDEKNEMDACIMDGRTCNSGAVAAVKNVKNPIKLARLVMEQTEHLLLAGEGAREFAIQMKAELEPDEYFFTDSRYQQLLQARAEGVVQLDHADEIINAKIETQPEIQKSKSKIGTVGATACDFLGNLAAATSTGGMTNKKFGRVGDTPIIGAGTYADNATCAVSCTGHGEYFMLAQTAFDVAARMKYRSLSLSEAANEAISRLTEIGGEGGLIAVDASGNIVLPFNSEGMYRGFVTSGEKITIQIYAN
jgi:beta-aspartyl-peptidase (threonine type)